jgi:NOL1/NOP2/fmu family ribosome biogenesis protein
LCRLLAENAFVREEVSKEEALKFLHKDAIVLKDAPRGLVLVTYMGLPLGFVKNLGNRTNNLHPQSRRIRMDIK